MTESSKKCFPKISVITPSYNQAAFIEQTLCSVLDQNYPNLEYIVIDGGSTDGSVEIIQKYAARLTYWVSEKDRGQSHAINKGFLRSTGDILCWLNSDDCFVPGTLEFVAEQLAPESGCFAIAGHTFIIYTDGRPNQFNRGSYTTHQRLLQFWHGYTMHQPAIFWRREVYEKVGLLDESLHYIMDFDYWVRISEHFGFKFVDRVLAAAAYHPQAKTGDDYAQYHADLRKHAPRYWGTPLSSNYWALQASLWNSLDVLPFLRRMKRFVRRRHTAIAPAVAQVVGKDE